MGSWQEILNEFILAWIPLFVAVDPIGLVPLFLGLTEGMDPAERRRVSWQAPLTAAAVSLLFLLLGRAVFAALGITIADFQVAGGLIFLVLAGSDLIGMGETRPRGRADVGVVPLGTPLVAGPAALVALLMLTQALNFWIVIAAFATNLILTWATFRWSSALARILGERGLRALSKITSLILAAYAVSMIRRGIEGFLA